jgi:hypothetical protein
MSTLAPTPKLQFFDLNGAPLSGGKLYTYAAGTTTPLASYTDSTGNIANTNPIILDSRGEANVWLAGASYKFALYDSTNVLIWTVDNINGGAFASNATGTGSQVSFSVLSGLSAVFINGVYQNKNTYTVSGNTLTFSEAPPYTSIIEFLV